jgi:hypothetical protein
MYIAFTHLDNVRSGPQSGFAFAVICPESRTNFTNRRTVRLSGFQRNLPNTRI